MRLQHTQSKALDSPAQTSGHSKGVIVPLVFTDPRRLLMSDSIVMTSEREEMGSVVDVQDSQDSVKDSNDPD